MVLFARAATTREAVARGWWFGAGYLIAMLYWMAPEIGPGLVLLGAVIGLDVVAVRRRGHRLLRAGRLVVADARRVPRGAGCWLIPEWIRSYQGLGGPWDLYGASQWQHPAVLALAAVGGVWLVSVALSWPTPRCILYSARCGPARGPAAAGAATRRRPRGAPTSTPPGSAPVTPAAPAPPRRQAGNGRTPRAPGSPRRRRRGGLRRRRRAGPLAFALTPPFPAVQHGHGRPGPAGRGQRPGAARRRLRDADRRSSAPDGSARRGQAGPDRLGRVEHRRRPDASPPTARC